MTGCAAAVNRAARQSRRHAGRVRIGPPRPAIPKPAQRAAGVVLWTRLNADFALAPVTRLKSLGFRSLQFEPHSTL